MKSNQSTCLRRGWTLRRMATEVSTCGNPLSLLALFLGLAALLAQIGCVGATAKTATSTSSGSNSGSSNSNSGSTNYVISAAPSALGFTAAVNGAAPAPETVVLIS